MSNAHLPARPSLEFLKKLAKERLREHRATQPDTKLSAVQLELAREYGFPSWRALKAEVDRRQSSPRDRFFAACSAGDVATLRELLDAHPTLVQERVGLGQTGLHMAVAHPEAVRLLLERGADPNARDTGDNALALHFAAAMGHLDSVRALLDAGSDVHGHGDLHDGDVIGWAMGDWPANRPVVELLIERGARHHIFSAIASGDPELVRSVVARDPGALAKRRSKFEQGQTVLHFALGAPIGLSPRAPRYDMARLLIELGADLEAGDDHGRTALAVAMLHGDLEAMRLLKEAGAKEPPAVAAATGAAHMDALRASMHRQVTPMLCVADVDAAVAWYTSLGFQLTGRFPEAGAIEWAALCFGKTELMVQSVVNRPRNQIALWFHTRQIDELYQLFKTRQVEAARAALAGEAKATSGFRFTEDLYEPFYGGRQFSIEDVNGFELVFQSE